MDFEEGLSKSENRFHSPFHFMNKKLFPIMVAGLSALGLPSLDAASLTWDADTGTTAAQDGAGTWNTSNTNWWNGSANVSFTGGDNATIGATTGASAVTLGGSLAVGNLVFTNNGSGKACTIDLGGNTLTVNGTLSTSGNVGGYSTFLSNGTLVLANPSPSASVPDITKVTTAAANYGSVINAAVNVGTGSRFITGTTDRNEVARYSGDLRFNGALSGSATLNFVGGAENNSHNMHFVLNAANSGFTGAVNLVRGDLALTNNAALSSSNALTFSVASGQRGSLFLFGHNVSIGSLNDTNTAGSRYIRNGSLVATNGGTNTANNGTSVALGLDANSVLTINQTAAGTFGGVIGDGPNDTATGAGGTYRTLGLVKSGTATLSLTGTNTYTGGTTLASGGLSINNASALGTGPLAITSATGVTLTVANTAAFALSTPISLPAPVTAQTYSLVKNTAGTTSGTQLNLGGAISGGSSSTKLYLNTSLAGDNTTEFRFAGNNSFVGTVHLNRGAITVTNVNSLGAASNPLILDANNNQTSGDLRFESSLTFSHPVGSLSAGNTNPINTNGFNVVFDNVVSGVASFTKVGTGTLSFNALNTYTGRTLVNGGTLAANTIANGGTSSSLGASASAAANLVFGGGTLSYTGATASSDRGFTIGATSTAIIDVTQATTALTLSGSVPATTGSLTKTGPGTLVLSGANLYTGATNVNAGTLAVSGSGSLASTAINVAADSVLDVTGLAGGLALGSGQTLSAGRASSPATDILGSVATNAGSLNVLTGSAAGTLTVSGDLTLNGGTVNLDLSNVAAAGNDQISVGGALNLTAPTTIQINRINAVLGSGTYVLVQAGSVTGTLDNVTFAGLPAAGSSRQTFTPVLTSNALTLVVGSTAASLVWTNGAATGLWSNEAADENWNNLTAPDPQDRFFASDVVTFADIVGQTNLPVTITADVSPASILVNNSAEGTTYTLAGGNITGATGLTKTGTGTLYITGTTHNFTGTPNFNGGTVNADLIADAGLPSSLGQGTGFSFDGGMLGYNAAVDASSNRAITLLAGGGNINVGDAGAGLTLSGVLGDVGALAKSGSGTLILSGTNTYAGGTTVTGGTLTASLGTTAGARSPFGSGAVTANAGTTVSFLAAATTNAMTIANALNLSDATFSATEASQTFTGAIGLTGANTFNVVTAGKTATLSGPVSGTGSLIKSQPGALVLSAANSYEGGTTVNGGTLTASLGTTAGARSIFGSGAIAVNPGATLRLFAGSTTNAMSHANTITLNDATLISEDAVQTYSGSVDLTGSNTINVVYAAKNALFTNSITGSGSLTKTGAGTLVLSGTNTYAGTTTVNAGQVTLTTVSAIGGGAITLGGGQLHFSLPSGSMSTLANDITLPATGTPELNILAPSTPTTVRVTGKISGGTAGQIYRLVDSQVTGNHNNVLILDNPNNDFQGTIEMWRGTLAFTSDASLGNPDNDIRLFTENLNGSLRFDADNITLNAGRSITFYTNANSMPINTQGFTGTIAGDFSGQGTLVKLGTGTLILTGTHNGPGGVTVNAGTLIVNGTFASGGGTVMVNAGATLGGTGSINRELTVSGTLAPGQGPGTLTVTGTTAINGTLAVDVDGALADKLAVTGNLNLGGSSALTMTLGGGDFSETSYVIAECTGALTGHFASVPAGYTVTYTATQAILAKASGFESWAALAGLDGTPGKEAGPADDPDQDGVPNLLEYILGGDPLTASAGILPVPARDATKLTLTFTRNDNSEGDTVQSIEFGNDLSGWTPALIPSASGTVVAGGRTLNFLITEDSTNPDQIVVEIPLLGDEELFARLKAVK